MSSEFFPNCIGILTFYRLAVLSSLGLVERLNLHILPFLKALRIPVFLPTRMGLSRN